PLGTVEGPRQRARPAADKDLDTRHAMLGQQDEVTLRGVRIREPRLYTGPHEVDQPKDIVIRGKRIPTQSERATDRAHADTERTTRASAPRCIVMGLPLGGRPEQ